jgi:excisionase family DNA binding protein
MTPTIKLFTREETAKALRISQVHLWRIVKQGKLQPLKIGSRQLFSQTELERFIGVAQ